MKLAEIIESNKIPEVTILIEKMIPYKKLLYAYYKDEFVSEPIVMVTSITNATQYGKIVPASEFLEAIDEYLDTFMDLDDPERETEIETINFNSIPLSRL